MASRLIVKNLPKTVTENQLRKTFSEQGTVTDCQLKYTKDGVFRKFAFIGFLTEAEAECAKDYFDQNFIGTSKIQVEVCRPFGDANKPRAWSRYAKGSSAYQKANTNQTETSKAQEGAPPTNDAKISKKKKKEDIKDLDKDPKFQEFLAAKIASEGVAVGSVYTYGCVAVDRLTGKSVHSDTATRVQSQPLRLHWRSTSEGMNKKDDEDSGLEADSPSPKDEDLLAQLLEEKPEGETEFLIVSGLPSKVKVKNLKEFIAPVRMKTVRVARGREHCSALLSFARKSDARRVLAQDGAFFGGFQLKVEALSLKDKREKQKKSGSSDSAESKPTNDEQDKRDAQVQKQIVDAIADSGRLFVRNLSYVSSVDDLQTLFGKFGQLSDVTMPIDKHNQRPKGFAMITFLFPEHAIKAYTELDGTIFQGRMLHLLAGKEKPGDESASNTASTFKSQRSTARKTQTNNWNALFLGSAAVADVLSGQIGADKSQLLDAESSKSLGVRMALGETQLVRETKEFLTDNGVALDSFGQADAPRSKTVILVKNLPANTNVDELKERFEKFGEVGRFVMPPAGISALVDFLDEQDAKKAFKALSYARFKTVPLFLEWAPGDVFGGSGASWAGSKNSQDDSGPKPGPSGVNAEDESNAKDGEEVEEEEPEAEPETTIFVKNLNFNTTDEILTRKFEKIGRLRYATVSKKKNPKVAGEFLSMGYGFVQFYRQADAQKAIKDLQSSLLEGHALELKLSDRQGESESGKNKRKHQETTEQGDCTKILVRNVPFQATAQEIGELFKVFGEIRTLRLPTKLGKPKEHRGFAFVDFLTKSEAKRAFEALCHSTHLYGRRLVLEWAKEQESVDDVRKRTAEHFAAGDNRAKRGKNKRKLMQTLETVLEY